MPDPASVSQAMDSRMSIRAFLPKPVPRAIVEEILSDASRAPSGANAQPWRVYVLQGTSRDELVKMGCDAHDALRDDPTLAGRYGPSYEYYPSVWTSPYIERRRMTGWGLYGLLGISKNDKVAMHAQHQRNYELFGAPVGLMFTVSRQLERGSMLDYGMFLQNIMLAARARQLHTCAQAAWLDFEQIVMRHIGAEADEMLVCGMALGWADPDAIVNRFETQREEVSAFARWV